MKNNYRQILGTARSTDVHMNLTAYLDGEYYSILVIKDQWRAYEEHFIGNGLCVPESIRKETDLPENLKNKVDRFVQATYDLSGEL